LLRTESGLGWILLGWIGSKWVGHQVALTGPQSVRPRTGQNRIALAFLIQISRYRIHNRDYRPSMPCHSLPVDVYESESESESSDPNLPRPIPLS